ncbi:MAG: NUDIX domain-containing protein [Rhodospirillaceae bacterium]|nr:NUDIX domain-containing protein [Rhodospirillaceae bacterium]MDD9998837.1 NUDIX domain-containing protein [Rhodospirillaceae bacterium]MDE0361959.1 NUDIX domain-containing protein [Rhodospirillaceae bacterium]
MAEFRRPESVLVVVYTPRLECLLLERVSPPGFWQSVTGTLQWGETRIAAAVRETREETGLVCAAPEPDAVAPESPRREGSQDRPPPVLRETNVTNRFPILPEWRHRYAPGVTENLEHLLYLELPGTRRVTLNDKEHVGYRWMGLEEAVRKATSWTNQAALERLRASLRLRDRSSRLPKSGVAPLAE